MAENASEQVNRDHLGSDAKTSITRRRILQGLGVAGVAIPAGWAVTHLFRKAPISTGPVPLKLAWSAGSVCLGPVAMAVKDGIFARHNLSVELVNFAGSTDVLLEAISTGKADAGIGMILRWLKPLEQGFNVRLVAGTHGGCSRMLGSKKAGVVDLPSLKGKVIAVSDVSGAARNTFAILLHKNGVDPNRDVEWRPFPSAMLGLAIEKGQAQAIADGDPNLYIIQKRAGDDLVEILSNLSAPWQHRVCCVLGVGEHLLRTNRPAATALAASLVEAATIASQKPELVAAAFAPYAQVTQADLVAILRSQTHNHHPFGSNLKQEIVAYSGELKEAGIFKPTTDPIEFANRVYTNVLGDVSTSMCVAPQQHQPA
jgi:NitT/TauT family transport system substrate-binding protein